MEEIVAPPHLKWPKKFPSWNAPSRISNCLHSYVNQRDLWKRSVPLPLHSPFLNFFWKFLKKLIVTPTCFFWKFFYFYWSFENKRVTWHLVTLRGGRDAFSCVKTWSVLWGKWKIIIFIFSEYILCIYKGESVPPP